MTALPNFDPQQIALRAVQEAMATALPLWWEGRAAAFTAVDGWPPLPLDAIPEQVSAASSAAQTALACRRHAWLLREGLPAFISEEIADALREAA